MITQGELRNLFRYEDGNLYWQEKIAYKINIGDKAGCINSRNYVTILVNKKRYQAHRLIFMFHHGYCPEFIDHIDGIRTNNKIENLRPATQSQNQWNCKVYKSNTSGVKGVYWHKSHNVWVSAITVKNKKIIVGRFKNIEDAKIAVKKARIEHHPQFGRQE